MALHIHRCFSSAFTYLSTAESCSRFSRCSSFCAGQNGRKKIFAGACGTCQFPTTAHFKNDLVTAPLPIRSYATVGTIAKPAVDSHASSGGFNLKRYFEDALGVTEVRDAQRNVLLAERDFEKMQEIRREKQDEIRLLQLQLKDVHAELDQTSRGEDRYLDLLTREHGLIKQEKSLIDEFKRVEHSERNCFGLLSTRLRESHEKERERAERTKYWSIIGSAVGALMGILGTTINNRLRIRELRNVVEQSSDPRRVKSVINQLSDTINSQQQQVAAFINDLKTMLSNRTSQWNSVQMMNLAHRSGGSKELDQWLSPEQSAEIMKTIKEQDKKMETDMQAIKKMIAAEHGYSMKQDGTIVYVGPEMQALLDQTEKNIDTKLKLNTLVAVVAIYGALALTLPLLYAFFKGS